MKNQDEEIDIFTLLSEMTPEEWLETKKIAIQNCSKMIGKGETLELKLLIKDGEIKDCMLGEL